MPKHSLDSEGQLKHLIEVVQKGQVIMDPSFSSVLFSYSECSLLREMTQREQEILSLVADGYTNEAIAKRLFIDVKTVEHHINNLYSKLKSVNDFAERHPRVHAARLYLHAVGSVTPHLRDNLIRAQ